MISYQNLTIVTSILFAVAVYGILSRRNGVTFIISAEIALNAAILNFVGGSDEFGSLGGASYALMVLVIAVIETVVIISMLITYYKRTGSISFSSLKNLKG